MCGRALDGLTFEFEVAVYESYAVHPSDGLTELAEHASEKRHGQATVVIALVKEFKQLSALKRL